MNYSVETWHPSDDGVGGEWRTVSRCLNRGDAVRLATLTPNSRVMEWRGGMTWRRVS